MSSVFNGGVRMFYTRPSDGMTYCFQPVPLLAESKEILRTGGGDERLGVIHQLTFNGTLIPNMPALSGVPTDATCISLLDRKRDMLCDALSEDRGTLLIVDGSGYPIVSAQPLVTALSFEEGILVQQSPYTVTFEYEEVAGTGYVREYSESWDFSQEENDTISVSHSIGAVGIPNPPLGKTSLDSARDFVKSKIAGTPDATEACVIQTPFVSALVATNSLTGYNKVLTETSDKTAGTYDVVESWVMSSGAFLDDRTINSQWNLNEFGTLIQSISVDGNVQGYGDTTFDKFENAIIGFNSFVSPQINFYAPSGISSRSRTDNRLGGSVSYSVELVPSGITNQLTDRSISRQIDRQDNGSVLQTVTTSCTAKPEGTGTIQDCINFCFVNNFPIDSAEPIFDAALSGNLISVNTSRDELQQSFSLTRVFTDQSTSLWSEEYNIDRQQTLDSSQTQITIQGTVQGLGVETSTKGTARFISASGAFFNIVEPLIAVRIAQVIPTGSCIFDEPITSAFGINPLNGTVTYSRTFESRFTTNNINILKEEIEITLARGADVIAVIPIPGKASGPILQDQETRTGLQKTISINYSMKDPLVCVGNTITSDELLNIAIVESDILINNTPSMNTRGEKPESAAVFKTEDGVTFSRQTNQFTRNVTWQYI